VQLGIELVIDLVPPSLKNGRREEVKRTKKLIFRKWAHQDLLLDEMDN
jgi:hypothetical protein